MLAGDRDTDIVDTHAIQHSSISEKRGGAQKQASLIEIIEGIEKWVARAMDSCYIGLHARALEPSRSLRLWSVGETVYRCNSVQ